MGELKPCPFCLKAASSIEYGKFVSCEDINCAGGIVRMSPTKWNTRAPSSPDAGAVREALRELAYCDGSPENVANTEALAARVRRVARAALVSIGDNGDVSALTSPGCGEPVAWRAIDSAPKDGSLVLLYWPPVPYAKKNWGNIRLGTWTGRVWKLEMSGHFRTDCSHWMPLPAPPAALLKETRG